MWSFSSYHFFLWQAFFWRDWRCECFIFNLASLFSIIVPLNCASKLTILSSAHLSCTLSYTATVVQKTFHHSAWESVPLSRYIISLYIFYLSSYHRQQFCQLFHYLLTVCPFSISSNNFFTPFQLPLRICRFFNFPVWPPSFRLKAIDIYSRL